MILDGKVILITGGTGSFGKKFVKIALTNYKPKKLIIFSRDEWKQSEMASEFKDDRISYFVGDVRDHDRLWRAFDGVDYVIHAAALKQIPSCEYNPFEAIQTNVFGAKNVIDAAIDRGVKKIIALSSDKAVNPINLYGATKLCSDKLFVAGNSYAGLKETRFSVVRYGNVIGSRGSVIPIFMKLREKKILPITDMRMTRFWITLEQGVDFVLDCLDCMKGGEIFIPKLPSMRVVDLARAISPDCELEVMGTRPGEKLHEVMISEDDSANVVEYDDYFVIQPSFQWWRKENVNGGKKVKDGFRYDSYSNEQWLSVPRLKELLCLS